MSKRSPLAPARFPRLPEIDGVEIAAVAAGIKPGKQNDLFLAALSPGSAVAGLFTQSLTSSAAVEWSREVVEAGKTRAIIVNSGNANAFTGTAGVETVKGMAAVAARQVGCRSGEVLIASTGVIGEPLPLDQIFRAEEKLGDHLGSCSWKRAAEAISTTDTFPKGAFATCDIGSKRVRIAGIAKGSGMIAPDMATMLGFIFTDAQIPQQLLQLLLVRIAGRTFNSITVDGDTSTSDTLVLAATGRAGNTPPLSIKDSSLSPFVDALEQVARDLATQIVRDGEGATKFITLEISGATSFQAARRVGLSIGNSPLVKTAIAGEDANWGRIVMAVGKAGERADRDQLEITIGGVAVVRAGERVIDYQEEPVADHLKGQEIQIGVDLGVGRGSATVWTCDLTHGYISINADYRS